MLLDCDELKPPLELVDELELLDDVLERELLECDDSELICDSLDVLLLDCELLLNELLVELLTELESLLNEDWSLCDDELVLDVLELSLLRELDVLESLLLDRLDDD